MVLALSAFSSTFGLILTFFVILPAIAQGVIGVAVAGVLGERADNQEYAAGLTGGDEGPRV